MSGLRVMAERGAMELKHWPCPFAGVAPKLRCWVLDDDTGARLELPNVQSIQEPYALGPVWAPGYYRVAFGGDVGGVITVPAERFRWVEPVVLDGEYGVAAVAGLLGSGVDVKEEEG